MKILLIKPAQWAFYHELDRYFPLGLCYLASVARNRGHEVAIFDGLAYKEDNRILGYEELSEGQREKVNKHPAFRHIIHWGASWERLREKLRSYQPDLVGITMMHSPMYDTAYITAEIAREECPQATIAAGGAHVSILWEHVLAYSPVDYAILGEGERSFASFLDCLDDDRQPFEVDGCAFRAKGNKGNHHNSYSGEKIYYNPKTDWIIDLDELPQPAVDLVEVSRYEGFTTLVTSRGCPFSCSFCTVHPGVGKQYRYRSPENVVDEIQWWGEKWGVYNFGIEDDNFTFDIERVERICELIIDRDLDVKLELPNGMTVLYQTEERVSKMARAGFVDGFIGLESTSKEMLKKVTKGFTGLDKVKKVIGWFRQHGAEIGTSLIVGLPEQSLETMVQDFINVVREDLPLVCSNPFYPLPPAKMYYQCLKEGYITKDLDFTWYDEYNFPVETEHFTRRQVYELWVASFCISIWPKFFRKILDKFYTMDEFIDLVNEAGNLGRIETGDGGFYYWTPKGKSFTERIRVNPKRENASDKVDTLSGELMAILTYLFTQTPVRCTQVESVLTGAEQAKFWLEADEELRSRGLDMLAEGLRTTRAKTRGYSATSRWS